jgi:hypothetical protein
LKEYVLLAGRITPYHINLYRKIPAARKRGFEKTGGKRKNGSSNERTA